MHALPNENYMFVVYFLQKALLLSYTYQRISTHTNTHPHTQTHAIQMKYDLVVSRGIVHSKHINSKNSKQKTAKSALQNVCVFFVCLFDADNENFHV